MSAASALSITSDGERIALDLYRVLKALDRARWQDKKGSLRERLCELQARALSLAGGDSASADEPHPVRVSLSDVAELIAEGVPEASSVRADWVAFRAKMVHAYEALAASLSREAVVVPSLRPANLRRSAFHVLSALATLYVLKEVLTPTGAIIAPAVFAGTFWFLEIARRVSDRWNDGLMWFFSPIAHPHERHRVNSSTWYATALLMVGLTRDPIACALCVVVLGFADPTAAWVGRRYGRVRLINGRTLEGSLAFVAAGSLAGLATLLYWHRSLGVGTAIVVAIAAALLAAIAELFSDRLDDNFTVPLAAAAGGGLVALLLV